MSEITLIFNSGTIQLFKQQLQILKDQLFSLLFSTLPLFLSSSDSVLVSVSFNFSKTLNKIFHVFNIISMKNAQRYGFDPSEVRISRDHVNRKARNKINAFQVSGKHGNIKGLL